MNRVRRHERVPISIPVYIAIQGRVLAKKIQLESFDVSGGGISFQSDKRIPVQANSRILVSKLGNLPPSAHIVGRVVYRWKNPNTGRYSIGVEFEKFVNVTQQELLQRIERWKVGEEEASGPAGD